MTLFRFTLILILLPIIISGQVLLDTTLQREIYLDHLGIEDGMSQGMINDMVIDQEGYMWIATKEGLNRYDGKKFKIYRHDPKNPLSISDNLVTKLFVDSRNNLWVGTDLNGLNLLDREKESFKRFNINSANQHKLSSNSIGRIFEDPEGNIIIQTKSGNGYDILIPDSTDNLPDYKIYPIQKVYPGLKKIMGGNCCSRHLFFKANASIWYYGSDSIYNIKDPTLENSPYHSYSAKLPNNNVYFGNQFVFDPQTGAAYILSNTMIEKYDSSANQFLPYIKLPKDIIIRKGLFIDKKSRLWITFQDNKWLNIDLKNKKLNTVVAKAEGFNDRGFCCTFFINHDQQDNLWIGTGGFGLLKWSGISQKFFLQNTREQNTPFWPFRIITPSEKADFIPEASNKWAKVFQDKILTNDTFVFAQTISQIVMGDDGAFYINLQDKAQLTDYLTKVSMLDDKINVIDEKKALNDMWNFSPIFFDKENNLLYSDRYSGDSIKLHYHFIKKDTIIEYPFPVAPQESIYRFILDWHETKAGNFWLGTTQGLFYFNPKKNKWNHYQHETENDSSLSLNMVLSICPDPENPDKYLWAGTNGGGLNKLNIETGNFITYKKVQGLPNDVVYGIQTDYKNNLWISTNNGLSHFNTSTSKFNNYNTNHGLSGNEFNRYEYSRADDGTLYFGGVNGVVAFQPKDFYTDPIYSNVIINQFKLNNQTINFRDTVIFENQPFFLPKPIEQLKSLTLDFHHRMLSFGFSVLDLTAQKANRIKYKLEGFQEEWIESDINQEATFTNLDPGNYTLKVIGFNSNNQWSKVPQELQLTILPPWWGTWWFRFLVLVAIFILLYMFYRFRVGQILKMERMRNQIAQDLHDEVGSTLSSISVYSAAMQKSSTQLPPKVERILEKIIDGTTETMERMNDMVWSIKSDNDHFKKVVLRMYALAVDITEVQDIQLQFNADERSENLEMNMLERKNIYLIYKEALNNAIKYAQSSIIEINVNTIGRKLHVNVTDNGIGFDNTKSKYNMGGNGLSGMYKRAKEIGAELKIISEKNKGTTVLLIFPI